MNFAESLALRFVPIVLSLFLLYITKTFVKRRRLITISFNTSFNNSNEDNKGVLKDQFLTVKRCDEVVSPFLNRKYVSLLTELLDTDCETLVWNGYIGKTDNMRSEVIAKYSYEFMLKEGFFPGTASQRYLPDWNEMFYKFGLISVQGIYKMTGFVRAFPRRNVRLAIDRLSIFRIDYDEKVGLLIAYALLEGLELMMIP